MVETFIFPWRDCAIKILIERELTQEEKRQVAIAFAEGKAPWEQPKSLTTVVEELKQKGLTDLADLIVFPS